MAREPTPRAVRRQVRDRAGNRCEYCQHPASYSCAPYACEHVRPLVKGSGNSPNELAWACPACNGHKYSKTHSSDPKTGKPVPLFNPRRQSWLRHFAWSADGLRIKGRTATGRATVAALHLNSPAILNLRRALSALSEHPPSRRKAK